MKKQLFLAVLLAATLAACTGEDRRGERPYAPTVENVAVSVSDSIVTMEGHVLASHNSTLLSCGFIYGNDSTRCKTPAADVQNHFFVTDTLEAGTYYWLAYATNGVGTGYAPDTLWFDVP